MTSKTACLLVGLLAIAEGHSEDMNVLREANRDDVLNVISPELLDTIAKRLYNEDTEHMSAYERLLHNDKQRKMDYLSNVKRDIPANGIPRSNELPHAHSPQESNRSNAATPQDKIDRVLREGERIEGQLKGAREMAQDERDYLHGNKRYFD